MTPRSWPGALRRAVGRYKVDGLADRAAALTYYSVLSIFPGLLVLISVLGLIGQSAVEPLVRTLTELAPGSVGNILSTAVINLENARGAAGVLAIVGLLAAVWSASNYVSAFMRATNDVNDVAESRPFWKITLIRLGLTIVVGLLLMACALIVVFTGRLAERAGHALGLGSALVRTWDIAKWPVLIILVSVLIAILYWGSPNVRDRHFQLATPGSMLAVLTWIIASAGFGVYVANFSSYNKTYGAVGGVIIFLIWLWISNLAVLFGAEFDAQLRTEPERDSPAAQPQ